jgi:hypothetical protein
MQMKLFILNALKLQTRTWLKIIFVYIDEAFNTEGKHSKLLTCIF